MSQRTPLDTVTALVTAINQGDLQAAEALYETHTSFVVQTDQVAIGVDARRKALLGMLALKPTLTAITHKTVQACDVALYCSNWSLTGTAADGSPIRMTGMSSDVLRQQANGNWLIAIDNPWGTGILV
jgi:ketosteroid isomerase-like protein